MSEIKSVRCEFGHYYDSAAYPNGCPHCLAAQQHVPEAQPEEEPRQSKIRAFVGRLFGGNNNDEVRADGYDPVTTLGEEQQYDQLQEGAPGWFVDPKFPEQDYAEEDLTVLTDEEGYRDIGQEGPIIHENFSDGSSGYVGETEVLRSIDDPEIPHWDTNESAEEHAQFSESERKIPDVVPEDQPLIEEPPLPGGQPEKEEPQDVRLPEQPVTGWLVCIKGVYIGRSFEIKNGENTIGSGNGNDIGLILDESVKENGHAVITYDVTTGKFTVKPGAGTCSRNDKLVKTPVLLKKYDTLEIGGCKFKLIDLCSERFDWNDYFETELS